PTPTDFDSGATNDSLIKDAEKAFDLVSNLRNFRSSKQLSPKEALDIAIRTENPAPYQLFSFVMKKLGNIGEIAFVDESMKGAAGFHIGTDECFIRHDEKIDPKKE